MKYFVNLVTFSFVLTIVSAKTSYEDYKVYEVVPKTDVQVEILNDLEGTGGIDFWSDGIGVNVDVRIMVSPESQDFFEEYLRDADLTGEIVIRNVQQLIDDQLKPAVAPNVRNTRLGSFDWYSYHSIEEIYAWFDELQSMYPDVVEVVVMGRSVEGREIRGVKIDYQPEGRNNTYIGMYEGGLHAREWISPATVTWIIKEFLTSTDPDVRALARNLVWHIFPVVNPDGYSYTFTNTRMWRKNRSTDNFRSCVNASDDMSNGVDLNRNFGFVWNTVGASDDPCSNLFAGTHPFSEPETLAISSYVHLISGQGQLIYYVAFHSYTQLIIMPHSHLNGTDVLQVDNFGDLFEIGMHTADAIKRRYGTQYRVGVSADVMYKMSGTSFDWVRNETNVPICYLFELRDLRDYGFLLPSQQIIPNNLEVMDGIIEMDRVTRLLGYYSAATTSVLSTLVLSLSCLIVILRI